MSRRPLEKVDFSSANGRLGLWTSEKSVGNCQLAEQLTQKLLEQSAGLKPFWKAETVFALSVRRLKRQTDHRFEAFVKVDGMKRLWSVLGSSLIDFSASHFHDLLDRTFERAQTWQIGLKSAPSSQTPTRCSQKSLGWSLSGRLILSSSGSLNRDYPIKVIILQKLITRHSHEFADGED
ncbi:unnamed protein product [Protopolystoma xenopodis]|uniref:Uncharacterized protein n=1 Tax=Protopolystoma xenopodis TaxID=117903 RepID=A0A448XGB0_9PLAT|nr:unnamed protein product [Protopolystoma xenopodis]